MTFRACAGALLAMVSLARGDASGYYLPTMGTASVTQFMLSPELSGGTSCGMTAFPNSASSDGSAGGGPGYLYAAINQLAFGANPSAGAGGPGGACGICYKLTPVSAGGQALSAQAMTFMIVDECPAAPALQRGASTNCNQCSVGSTNGMGQNWHFDIGVDGMNSQQYSTFFNTATYGSDWLDVDFQQVSCNGTANSIPPIEQDWGCMSGCSNNDAAAVCANV